MSQQLPAKLIGQRYNPRALIGRGGMGAVYLADDTVQRRRVALKVIRPEFSSDPRTRRRFNKESRAFAYLKHPNIVEVYDFGQDAEDGTLYLAMELVKGYSLRVLRHVDLPLAQVIEIIDQLLGALAHAHARGVIHRDLKPENVLVAQFEGSTDPVVKLVDFGLASLPTMNEMSHTGSILGTPSYMAPEQARGPRGVVGPSTDIYAVGVILYELLCNRLPFEADNQVELILKHVQQPVPPLRPREGLTAPPGLEEVVHRAMAKKPWDRFVNAAEFRRALRAVEIPFEAMPLLEPPEDAPWLLPDVEDSAPRSLAAANSAGQVPGDSGLRSLSFSVPAPDQQLHPSIDINAVANSIDAVMQSPLTQLSKPATFQTPSQSTTQSGTNNQAVRLARPRSSARWRPISSQSIPVASLPSSVTAVAATQATSPLGNVAAALFGQGPANALVGREAEVNKLDQIGQLVLAGQGQVVLIDGEQGIGKSQLARAALHRFTETGTMRAALGVYTATEGGGPNAGIRGAIESLFNTTNSDRASMEQQARGVLERLGIHDPRDQREVTLFLRPVSAEDALSGALSEDALQRQRSRMALVQRLLRLVAQEMPLILLLEDIHWSNDGVTGFLESMLNTFRVQRVPCLVLCTLTSAEIDAAGMVAEGIGRLARLSGQGLHQINLGRLSKEASLSLIQRLMPMNATLADRLAERTGGNPLYTVQMLQSLQQDRQLVQDTDKDPWQLADGVTLDSVLPTSVAEVLRRRLQRASTRLGQRNDVYQQILLRVAVMGASCDVSLLEAYLQLEADDSLLSSFDDALDAWVQHGILREVRGRGGDLLEFDHPLLRDVLLESVPRRKLRRLHLHAANLKRDRFYPALAPVASDISEHYRQAGEVGLAAEYTLMAARHHETTGQFRQAISLYERLHRLYVTTTGDSQPSPLGSINTPRSSPSVPGLDRNQLTPPSGTHTLALDWSEVWLGLGRIAITQGHFDRARAFADLMQRVGEQHQQMLPQAKAQWLMGRVATRRSALVDAWEHYNLARDLFEAENDSNGVALCLWGMGEVARQSGWLEDARNYVTSAMSAFEEAKRQGEVAACHLALGNIASASGLLLRAQEHYKKAQDTFTTLSDLYHIHHSLLGLAQVALSLGQVEESYQQFKKLAAVFSDLGDRHGQALCQQGMACALLEVRQYDLASPLLDEALNTFQQLSDLKSASHIQRLQAMLMRWRGAAAQAIHYIGQATEYFVRASDRQGIGACYLERSWIALELGDAARATEHLDLAYEHYNQSGDALGAAACAELCAHIALVRREPTRALEFVHQGIDITDQTGAAPLRARLLAVGLDACAQLQSWTELRSMVSAFDALQLPPQTLGAPQVARSLRSTSASLNARPSLEPDLRALIRRLDLIAQAAEGGAVLSDPLS